MTIGSELFKRTVAKRILFFVACDIICIAFSVWLAFVLRFDGSIPSLYTPFALRMAILAIIFTIPVFYFQKLYFFSWSYVSINELMSLVIGTTISFFFLTIAIFISKYFPNFINFPRSTIFISYVLTLVLCAGVRFSKKAYMNFRGLRLSAKKDRTLIVGAGDAGEQLVRSILSTPNSPYYPVGFVDDNPIKQGVTIHRSKVLGKIVDIKKIVQAHEIERIIIALPSSSNKVIRQAVELSRQAGVRKIKIAPAFSEVMHAEASLKNLKDIDVEDLLGRQEIDLDKKQIEQCIKGKTILITGAAGSIGSELSRQVASFNPALLLVLDQDETGIFTISKELVEKFPLVKIQSIVADITDKSRVVDIFSRFLPSVVFHAAAYKHVPLMEENPSEAVKNNVMGTHVLAELSVESGVEKFVFISTDKAINPTSVMGTTKRLGEMVCQMFSLKGKTSFISVRFGNVLDSRGSVIPIFREQIKKGGPVEVTHKDMTRYFMLTSEACLLVMQAAAMGKGGEVFVLDMGKPIKIVDLAREMIRLSGYESDRDIAIVFIGMRPGEKLFEEIMTQQEGIGATKNQKIFTVRLASMNVVEFEEQLRQLEMASMSLDSVAIHKSFVALVPSYMPFKP